MKIKSKAIKGIPGYKFGDFPCEASDSMQAYQTGEEDNAIELLNFKLDISKVIMHPNIEIRYFYDGGNHEYDHKSHFLTWTNCQFLLDFFEFLISQFQTTLAISGAYMENNFMRPSKPEDKKDSDEQNETPIDKAKFPRVEIDNTLVDLFIITDCDSYPCHRENENENPKQND